MGEKSIVIIGAGVAGLATGCYARMNGYRTQIVEMAARPGGVCTSWHRQHYTFDGCIGWLVGSRPGTPFNHVWQELGALTGREVVNHDEFVRIEGRDGQSLIVYTDADRLERHLCELAPEDAELSRTLCGVIRRMAALDPASTGAEHGPLAAATGGLSMAAGLLPALPRLVGWFLLTWQEFAARFTNRFVRDAFRSIFDLPDFPLLVGLMQLAWMHARDAGYPIGGSLAFAQGIEQRYCELGGEVTYDARVEKILVEGDRAVGVRLSDATEIRADYVISAADGHSTIFDLLEGRYLNRRIRRQYESPQLYSPLVQVSLGVARALPSEPHALSFPLPTPVRIAGQTRESLTVRHYGYDPTMAPQGKSVLVIPLDTAYDAWADLARDPDRYSAEKRSIAETVVAALDGHFPGLAADVEVIDVATPMTWVRHTGNWRGSYEGFLATRGTIAGAMRAGRRTTLPGLAGFFMTGQWVTVGGGLPNVAPAGRSLVKQLCKRDGKRFVTSIASHPPARLMPDFGESMDAAEPQRPQA